MNNRLLHVFFEVNMGNQHDGLAILALERKVSLKALQPGELVCFVNKAQTRLKIVAGTGEPDGLGIIAYYRSPKGRLDLRALKYIPTAFNGSAIDFKVAIKKSFESRGIVEV
jgi:hypothetical protein